MSNLTAAQIVFNEIWMELGASSRRFKALDVTLTLTGQGTPTNLITPNLFGLSKFRDARAARDSNNNIVPVAPAYDGSNLLVGATAPTQLQKEATGLASAGNITASGVTAAMTVLSVEDLTTPAVLNNTFFTPGSGVIAQASGAGDIHTKSLLFTLLVPTVGAPGFTGIVRLTVSGDEGANNSVEP